MKEIVITHGVRTPIGKFGSALKNCSDLKLASLVMEELVRERAKLDPAQIDHVIFGEVRQSSDPSNIARAAALAAGIPEQVPAYTVHRQCGSGLQAIMDAYQLIACGEAHIVVAGGAENMSRSLPFTGVPFCPLRKSVWRLSGFGSVSFSPPSGFGRSYRRSWRGGIWTGLCSI